MGWRDGVFECAAERQVDVSVGVTARLLYEEGRERRGRIDLKRLRLTWITEREVGSGEGKFGWGS